MSGMVLNVVPPTMFDFGRVRNTSGASQTILIAQRIDASSWESATLRVRLFSGTSIGGGNDTIVVAVTPHGYTADDPSTDFGNVGSTLASVSIGPQAVTPIVVPDVAVSQLTAVPSLLKVTVTGAHAASPNASLQARISVDLIFKTGGPARLYAPQTAGVFLGYAPGSSTEHG